MICDKLINEETKMEEKMYNQMEERINIIIAMIMAIAHVSEEMASELFKSTITYRNIVQGEECTLYESYSANLEDAIQELQEEKHELVQNSTEENVSKLNRFMLDKEIITAEELKEYIKNKGVFKL